MVIGKYLKLVVVINVGAVAYVYLILIYEQSSDRIQNIHFDNFP